MSFYSCKSESTEPEVPRYEVQYKVTGTVVNISEIKYSTYDGDTLTAKNVEAGWNYKWTQNGYKGDKTFIKVTLVNESGYVVLYTLVNNSELVKDTLKAVANGSVSLTRGVTIP
jgi:hypothetical protein